jgi:outer membrane protein, multidrug efflux system
MRFSRVVVVLSAFVCAGCDMAPPYRAPKVDLPAKFKEAGNVKIAEPSDDLPRGAWWTTFRDPTLNALEPQVDEENQTLAVAFANYEIARANLQQAEAGLFPTLDQYSQFTDNRQSEHRTYRTPTSGQPNYYGNNELLAQASYEVDLWGRVHDTIKSNAAQVQAQAALLENVRLSLHGQLANAYVALRGIDRDLKLLKDTQKAYQDALTLTENRFAGKIASPMDVDRAKAELETAKALLDDDMVRRALLEHAIATLVGKPASSFSIPSAPIAVGNPKWPTAAPSSLLERRPDVAASERQVAAANQQVGIARTAFYPRFFLNLSAGTEDRGLRLFDLQNALYSIGPSVTLPIFDGGVNAAQLKAAYAGRDAALATYRQTVLHAVQDVEDALASRRYLSKENQRLNAAVDAERRVLAVALDLYRDGATAYLDVTTAQEALLGQQRAALGLLTRQLAASVNLFVALGGGWSPPENVAANGPT